MLEMPPPEWIAERLKELHKKSGVSKARLAEAAGVSAQAAGQWFKKGRIKFITLARIAPLLNATIEEILWPGERVSALSKPPEGAPSPELTPVQLSLVKDFEDLTEEQREELIERVREQAKRNNDAFEVIRKQRGWPSPVPDHEVAKHIAPAPRISVPVGPNKRKAGA